MLITRREAESSRSRSSAVAETASRQLHQVADIGRRAGLNDRYLGSWSARVDPDLNFAPSDSRSQKADGRKLILILANRRRHAQCRGWFLLAFRTGRPRFRARRGWSNIAVPPGMPDKTARLGQQPAVARAAQRLRSPWRYTTLAKPLKSRLQRGHQPLSAPSYCAASVARKEPVSRSKASCSGRPGGIV